MRRRLSFAVAALALAAPIAAAVSVHGCSDEQPFDSVCLWVSDPYNCYREFRKDSLSAGDTCKPFGDPSPVELATNSNGSANGKFLARDKLDICYVGGGGQVIFDPPIDLANYPPPLLSPPITYKMTFKRADGSACGSASYSSPHGFSFTIDPPPNATDAGAEFIPSDAGPVDAGRIVPNEPYGTFTEVIQPGRDAFDVTCPSGEAYHFNLFEVEGAGIVTPSSTGDASATTSSGGATSSGGVLLQETCRLFSELVPRASLAINPGGINVPGAVSFTIYWPPTDVVYDSALLQTATPIPPVAVTYFNCSIGAQPEVCVNGAKDGAETDIDCGGAENKTGCPARCGDGQGCVTNCDCDPMLDCNVVSGVRICGAPGGGAGGSPQAPATRDCSAFIICQDGQKNGAETDTDCGGTDCGQCADGQTCLIDGDCVSTHCIGLVCATPNCTDDKKNLGETDKDCGGPCPPCLNGSDCLVNADCTSGNCFNLKCGDANCMDTMKNGTETDINCGGNKCSPCDNLKTCLVNSDCKSNACVMLNGKLVCLFPSCSDSTLDGNETDKDCGGPDCDPCADGMVCSNDTDCLNGICRSASLSGTQVIKRCFPTSCNVPVDAGADGAGGGPPMTMLACGGACPLCDNGVACKTNADCLNQGCISGACVTATCSDNAQDGVETDVDCGGGKCTACIPSKKCLADSDCLPAAGSDASAGTCINKVCQ